MLALAGCTNSLSLQGAADNCGSCLIADRAGDVGPHKRPRPSPTHT